MDEVIKKGTNPPRQLIPNTLEHPTDKFAPLCVRAPIVTARLAREPYQHRGPPIKRPLRGSWRHSFGPWRHIPWPFFRYRRLPPTELPKSKGRYEPSRASRPASALVKSPSPRTTTNTPPESDLLAPLDAPDIKKAHQGEPAKFLVYASLSVPSFVQEKLSLNSQPLSLG